MKHVIRTAAVAAVLVTMTGCASQPPRWLVSVTNGIRYAAGEYNRARALGQATYQAPQHSRLLRQMEAEEEAKQRLRDRGYAVVAPHEQSSDAPRGYDWTDTPASAY